MVVDAHAQRARSGQRRVMSKGYLYELFMFPYVYYGKDNIYSTQCTWLDHELSLHRHTAYWVERGMIPLMLSL